MNDKTTKEALKIATIETIKLLVVVMFIGIYIEMAINHTDSNYFIALNLIIIFAIHFYMAFEVNYDKKKRSIKDEQESR